MGLAKAAVQSQRVNDRSDDDAAIRAETVATFAHEVTWPRSDGYRDCLDIGGTEMFNEASPAGIHGCVQAGSGSADHRAGSSGE
jgi:hypothetical protein